MIALYIILAHLTGDYILQPNWIAEMKTQRWREAIIHGILYTIPYAFITLNPWALLIIGGTHIVIDRYRLIKYINYAKNQLGPKIVRYKWSDADGTGYHSSTPAWLSTWLMIIADNTLHLAINTAAIVIFVL